MSAQYKVLIRPNPRIGYEVAVEMTYWFSPGSRFDDPVRPAPLPMTNEIFSAFAWTTKGAERRGRQFVARARRRAERQRKRSREIAID